MSDELKEILCWIAAFAGGSYFMLVMTYSQTSRLVLLPWGLY